MRFQFQLIQTQADLFRMFVQYRRINFDAITLNTRQHRHQRHFNIFENIQWPFLLLQFRVHLQVQLQSYVRIFRRIAARLFQGDLVEGQLVFALSGNLFKGDGFMLEPPIGQ
ncbi:hypothetical protein D3C81_1377190 [compost metagenome]